MNQDLDDLCKQFLADLDDDLGGLYLSVREDNEISRLSQDYFHSSIKAMQDKIRGYLARNA